MLIGVQQSGRDLIVFCGSKKSLANGIPMANILFPAATVGIMVLPLMVFHQVQLMTLCGIGERYQRKRRWAQQAVPNAQASRG